MLSSNFYFIKTPSPPIFMTPFYSCHILPPSPQVLMPTQRSVGLLVRLFTPLPPLNFASQIPSVLTPGNWKIFSLRSIPGTEIPWLLLRRYYLRESKKRVILRCRERPLCIHWERGGSRTCKPGFPLKKWNWGLWRRGMEPRSLLVSSGFFIHDI